MPLILNSNELNPVLADGTLIKRVYAGNNLVYRRPVEVAVYTSTSKVYPKINKSSNSGVGNTYTAKTIHDVLNENWTEADEAKVLVFETSYGAEYFYKVKSDITQEDIVGIQSSVLDMDIYYLGELYHSGSIDVTSDAFAAVTETLLYIDACLIATTEDIYDDSTGELMIPKGLYLSMGVSLLSETTPTVVYVAKSITYSTSATNNTDSIYTTKVTTTENDTYRISIYMKDPLTSISFSGMSELLTVEKLITDDIVTFDAMFEDCTGLISTSCINYEGWDLSKASNFRNMFCGCTNLLS